MSVEELRQEHDGTPAALYNAQERIRLLERDVKARCHQRKKVQELAESREKEKNSYLEAWSKLNDALHRARLDKELVQKQLQEAHEILGSLRDIQQEKDKYFMAWTESEERNENLNEVLSKTRDDEQFYKNEL